MNAWAKAAVIATDVIIWLVAFGGLLLLMEWQPNAPRLWYLISVFIVASACAWGFGWLCGLK